jgi:hypothetical protein
MGPGTDHQGSDGGYQCKQAYGIGDEARQKEQNTAKHEDGGIGKNPHLGQPGIFTCCSLNMLHTEYRPAAAILHHGHANHGAKNNPDYGQQGTELGADRDQHKNFEQKARKKYKTQGHASPAIRMKSNIRYVVYIMDKQDTAVKNP